MIWLRNSMAASCSNLKRSRMELLASMSRPTRKRQVGLAAEGANRLRRLVVVDHPEVVLLQVVDELAALVGDVEDHVDFVHLLDDGGELLFLFIVALPAVDAQWSGGRRWPERFAARWSWRCSRRERGVVLLAAASAAALVASPAARSAWQDTSRPTAPWVMAAGWRPGRRRRRQ